MSKFKKLLPPLLVTGFIVFGVSAYLQSRPESKNEIYQQIHTYSPYYLDKRLGGLRIMSKTDKEFKEEPGNMEVFHRFDALEKEWGKNHLRLEDSRLYVMDDANNTVGNITVENAEDRRFIEKFYGIHP